MMPKNYRHPAISARHWAQRADENGMFYAIELAPPHLLLIDVRDVAVLADHHWFAITIHSINYVMRSADGGTKLLHREIMLPPRHLTIDHKDGNGLNNRRHNMRMATLSENDSSSPNSARGVSGLRGVYRDKYGHWYAAISLNNRLRYLGRFDDPTSAAMAYDAAAIAARGEFTCLNFPNAQNSH